jgi:hypothetical protein
VVKQTWWSRRALGLHAVIIVIIPTFAALCIWQITRALDGNQLSWAYVFEWPFFAGYAVYMWWRFLHEAPGAGPAASTGEAPPATEALEKELRAQAGESDVTAPDAEASERAAYNEYLAALSTRGKRKEWR